MSGKKLPANNVRQQISFGHFDAYITDIIIQWIQQISLSKVKLDLINHSKSNYKLMGALFRTTLFKFGTDSDKSLSFENTERLKKNAREVCLMLNYFCLGIRKLTNSGFIPIDMVAISRQLSNQQLKYNATLVLCT